MFAQSPADGQKLTDVEIKSYGILPDLGYSTERIRTDTTLVLVQDDSLRPLQVARHLVKVEAINRSRYAQPCLLTVLPNIDNTLFYFNEDVNDWITQRVGINVGADKGRIEVFAFDIAGSNLLHFMCR